MRPDLTGNWVLNRDACELSTGASAVRSAKLRIEHDDPPIRCAARFEFNDGNVFEFTTESTAIEADSTPAADGSARWDGRDRDNVWVFDRDLTPGDLIED